MIQSEDCRHAARAAPVERGGKVSWWELEMGMGMGKGGLRSSLQEDGMVRSSHRNGCFNGIARACCNSMLAVASSDQSNSFPKLPKTPRPRRQGVQCSEAGARRAQVRAKLSGDWRPLRTVLCGNFGARHSPKSLHSTSHRTGTFSPHMSASIFSIIREETQQRAIASE